MPNRNVEKRTLQKIESLELFESLFGRTPTSSASGAPTEINFDTFFVIALSSPETNIEVYLQPVRLQKDKSGKLLLSYREETGERKSYTTKPSFQIMVSKTEKGEIELRKLQ